MGSAGAGALRVRAIRALIGVTTKKYTAAAISKNEIRALMKLADRKNRGTNVEVEAGKGFLACQKTNQWSKKGFGETGHDRSKSRADDHANRQIDNISPQNECLESAQHAVNLQNKWRSIYAKPGRESIRTM